MTEEEEERFILAYFRSRAMEVLDQNRTMVEKLAKDFEPTSKGDVNTPSRGVSPAAQALIDSSKKHGQMYRDLLENEALVNEYAELLGWRQSFGQR